MKFKKYILLIVFVVNNRVSLAQLPPSDSFQRFKVEEINVNGSTVLKAQELKAIAAPLIGKEVTLEQILQLRT